jgi:phosphoribosylformylglycinamidine synthase
LKIPVTGGNVSFYNESEYGAVYPTPVIGMVGLISDISITTDMGFKTEGDIIVLLGEIKDELGGSEYLKIIHNILDGEPPELDIKKEKAIQQVCLTAFNKGIIKSAHDCAEGGIAVALAECCIQGKYGAEIEILQDNIHPVSMLFGETQSRIIVTVDNNNLDTLIEIITYENIPYSILGEVRGKNLIINKFINLPVSKMEAVYKWIK